MVPAAFVDPRVWVLSVEQAQGLFETLAVDSVECYREVFPFSEPSVVEVL